MVIQIISLKICTCIFMLTEHVEHRVVALGATDSAHLKIAVNIIILKYAKFVALNTITGRSQRPKKKRHISNRFSIYIHDHFEYNHANMFRIAVYGVNVQQLVIR